MVFSYRSSIFIPRFSHLFWIFIYFFSVLPPFCSSFRVLACPFRYCIRYPAIFPHLAVYFGEAPNFFPDNFSLSVCKTMHIFVLPFILPQAFLLAHSGPALPVAGTKSVRSPCAQPFGQKSGNHPWHSPPGGLGSPLQKFSDQFLLQS